MVGGGPAGLEAARVAAEHTIPSQQERIRGFTQGRSLRRVGGIGSDLLFVGLAVFLVGVFAIAIGLNPYENGKPRREETHRQLGLPPCTFKVVSGTGHYSHLSAQGTLHLQLHPTQGTFNLFL